MRHPLKLGLVIFTLCAVLPRASRGFDVKEMLRNYENLDLSFYGRKFREKPHFENKYL